MLRVLVTGATGFVGSALVAKLASDPGLSVRAAVRRPIVASRAGVSSVEIRSLDATTVWEAAVSDIDVVVHAAARVHAIGGRERKLLAEFRRVNVDGTLNLARQAAIAGVRRFVFLSSIKVNGERTGLDDAFRADDPPKPVDPYALSKHEAELGLWGLTGSIDMEVVVVRPTLVYGPGVKANFESMMRWLHRRIPLPLGSVHNKRSFVSLGNLVDFLGVCSVLPEAANRTWLVSDGEDLSTPELLRRLGVALGKPVRLFGVRPGLLDVAAAFLGCREQLRRLTDSLRVDLSETRARLNWSPPESIDEALSKTAQAFLRCQP